MNLRPFFKVVGILDRINPTHIVALAGLIRLAFCLAFIGLSGSHLYAPLTPPLRHEAGIDGYIQLAETLFRHGEYTFVPGGEPVSFRGPLQPLLMAATSAWSQAHWAWYWGVASVLLSSAVVYCTGKLVEGLGSRERWVQNLAMIAVAIHPYMVFSTKTPSAIVTTTLVFTLFAWVLLRCLRSGRSSAFGALGFLGGLGCLLHGSFLPLLIVALSCIVSLPAPSLWTKFCRLGLVLGFCAIPVFPWAVRNARAFGEPFPLLTGSGLQYWIAEACYFEGATTTDDAYEAVANRFEAKYGKQLSIQHGGVARKDDLVLLADAKRDIRENPRKIPVRFLQGLWRFWAPTDSGPNKAIAVGLMNLPFLALWFLGIGYLAVQRRLDRYAVAVFLLCAVFYGLFAVLQAISVYFVVIVPALCALSAISAREWLKGSRANGSILRAGLTEAFPA